MQLNLFDDLKETDLLFSELQELRASMHKLRKKFFKELDDIQTELKQIKEDNIKIQFASLKEPTSAQVLQMYR